MRPWRRSLVLGVSSALLAAVVVCPLMATVTATPAASNCHGQPGQDHHGDTSAAFTCCATLVAVPSVHSVPEGGAALPFDVQRERHPGQHLAWHSDQPRPRSSSPPLFLRHASLLI